MKNKILVAGTIAVSIAAPSVFASYFNDPYVGFEAIQTSQKFKHGYGEKVFQTSPQNYNVFGGFNFNKNFGAELGYDYQPTKTKFTRLEAGDFVPGVSTVITSGNYADMRGTYKTSNPYAGVFGEWCTGRMLGMRTVKFQALLAASVSHVKAQTAYTRDATGVFNIVRNYSKTKVVPMVKLSATGAVTQHVGVRVSLNYRNMSSFKITSKESTGSVIKLKDSYGVGLGLTYSF